MGLRILISPFSIVNSPLARLYQGIKDPLRLDIHRNGGQFLRMPLDSYGEGVALCFHCFYNLVWGSSGNGQPWCHVLDRLVMQAVDPVRRTRGTLPLGKDRIWGCLS
jgi:hypothetical protein